MSRFQRRADGSHFDRNQRRDRRGRFSKRVYSPTASEREFLKKQGYTDSEVDAVIDSYNIELNERMTREDLSVTDIRSQLKEVWDPFRNVWLPPVE
jgi:hypothetical protein